MRLLFVANVFPNPLEPTKGVFNRDLVLALARDHDVTVVSPVAWATELNATRSLRAELRRNRATQLGSVAVHHPRYWYTPKVLRRWYGAFYWWSARGALSRVAAARRPDAVIGYWAHPDGAAAVRLARQIGVPSVIMVGGSDVLVVTGDRSRRARVARVLRSADAVITVSRDLESRIAGFGIPAGNIHLWQRGVDGCFTPGDRLQARRRVGIGHGDAAAGLWVGRLVPVKGLEVLLQACQIARARGAYFEVYLVGDGPLRRSLESDRDARGLRDVVHFVGVKRHEELPDWYRAADMMLLPSWSEGLPNVLRESKACGTRFVASRVGGIPEIAGPEDRLVPPGDAAAMADAIVQSLAEAPIGGATKESEQTRPLSWAESASALIDIVKSVTPGQVAAPAPTTFSVVPT